jgi:hypothetical protein
MYSFTFPDKALLLRDTYDNIGISQILEGTTPLRLLKEKSKPSRLGQLTNDTGIEPTRLL